MKSRVIGISGVAGAGKDTFLELLQDNLPNVRRFALADNLKKECNPFFIQQYGLDIFTCSRDEKNLLRPILVVHGKMRRIKSKGQHWTGLLQKEIEAYLAESQDNVAVVTDVRYDVYENDEIDWLRKVMGGKLVHIKRYTELPMLEVSGMGIKKIFIEPPNDDERENDPRLQAKSDFKIEWPTVLREDGSIDKQALTPYVTEFISFLQRQN